MKYALAIVGVLALAVTATAGAAVVPGSSTIEGKYVEVRSCDVYTAACFANSEAGLTGEEAILAWSVTNGAWRGTDLDGLSVIAVVRATGTLGAEPTAAQGAKAVLLVDERANAAQQTALADLAQELGGELVRDIVRTEPANIEFRMEPNAHMTGASIKAGNSVEIQTRSLHAADDKCGNDEPYYAPLTSVENAMVHYTVVDKFDGDGLGVTWDDTGRRSAYLATFSR